MLHPPKQQPPKQHLPKPHPPSRTRASAGGDEKDAACAARLRLIALLATDAAFRDTIEPLRTEIMAIAMLFNAVARQRCAPNLAGALHARRRCNAFPERRPNHDHDLAGIRRGPIRRYDRARSRLDGRQKSLFETALDLLEKGVSTRYTFIATSRLLLFPARDARCARLRLLLLDFSVEAPATSDCHAYAVTIMRHLVEDKALLKLVPEGEMEAWFGGMRSKVLLPANSLIMQTWD